MFIPKIQHMFEKVKKKSNIFSNTGSGAGESLWNNRRKGGKKVPSFKFFVPPSCLFREIEV